MNDYTVLIQRIDKGWYDDKLEVLLSNAEKQVCIPVWKSCYARQELLGRHHALAWCPTFSTPLPPGVSCSVCAPGLRSKANEIGGMLHSFGLHSLDVGLSPSHIRAFELFGCDAIGTRIGNRTHHVDFYTVLEAGAYIYIVDTIVPGWQGGREVFDNFHAAHEYTKKEVFDECILEDS